GALYELIGEGYDVDTDAKVVSGPLVAGGQATGIQIEVRTGGPAIGFNPVSVAQYTDDTIHLGYANTEGQVVRYADTPVISVVAPLEINPQIIFWDPETYPDVETLADLGEEGVTINYFEGGTFAAVFVGNGTWTSGQIEASYDGTPGRFIAEDGAIAQQGFASAEPYTYENVFEEWGRPVRYQTLHDAGFEVYSQTLAVRPDKLEELRPCLASIVPIVQQAQIDFINAPERANAIIVDAVERYADSWQYDEGLAAFSVQTQKELGFVGNGPDDTLGNMDEARIQTIIDQIRDDAGLDVPEDLVASDLFTNEFIDESIGL
ncbi:MAG: ABC transporter substrate-binding protein, partial [Acidimicrobiia bacterium]|nr:ABC transporter substrate-binding protein [Acidimicrobiia bacterium]